jgi:hypothetical protein
MKKRANRVIINISWLGLVIKSGKNRIVIILSRLGIAVKLPIFHLFAAMKEFFYLVILCFFTDNKKSARKLLKGFFTKPLENEGIFIGFKAHLFGGLVMNWREFIFFMKTRDPFLQPTYFSFFGFVNVEKYGRPSNLSPKELRERMIGLFSAVVYEEDAHHFANKDNFCENGEGDLRTVDYGSRSTQTVIAKRRAKIHEAILFPKED